MNIARNIVYAPSHGERGKGDLYLPDTPGAAPAALVIHGGGWQAMDKGGLAGVAMYLAERGFGAFAINYRLIGQNPWPAGGDDCLAAARFLSEAGHETMAPLDRSRLLIVGASAGGHLAMMTGLRFDPGRVSAIVSIAGPSDLSEPLGLNDPETFSPSFWRTFFGQPTITRAMRLRASPIALVASRAPPLLCIHSVNDLLVPLAQSELAVETWRGKGCRAELYAYAGKGDSHGIWLEGTEPHRLLPEIEEAMARFVSSI